MKGLRPLHASQELKRDFFDNLRPPKIFFGGFFVFFRRIVFFVYLHKDAKVRNKRHQKRETLKSAHLLVQVATFAGACPQIVT